MRRTIGLLAALLGFTAAFVGGPASAGASGNSVVIPPSATVYGKTYGQWSATWWQWAYQTPWKGPNGRRNLLVAPDGHVDCGFGQTSNKVWFLAGTFTSTAAPGQPTALAANRQCTVPRGTKLFFPIVNAEQDNVDATNDKNPPTHYNVAQLAAAAKGFMDPVRGMRAWIDGKSVPGLSNTATTPFRVKSPLFSYCVPSRRNSLYAAIGADVPAGRIPPPGAKADGAFVMLRPLSPGVHHLHWVGGVPGPDGFSQDIRYTITVK